MNRTLEEFSEHADASISTIHHVLSAPRRRLVILLLTNYTNRSRAEHHSDGELSVRDLSKQIVSIEQSIPVTRATGKEYKSVYNSLTQLHLGKLDFVGVLKYQEHRKLIEPDENLEAFATIASQTTPLAKILLTSDVDDLYKDSRNAREDSSISN